MTVTLDLASLKDAHTRRSLADLSLSVAKSKKIVVVTGAGISCSCGIPVRTLFFHSLILPTVPLGFPLIRRSLCLGKATIPGCCPQRP